MSEPKFELKLPSKALNNKIDYAEVVDDADKQQEVKVLHGFQIDNVGLLLRSEMTSELLTSLPICGLPNTNRVLHGMGNLRGNIIPVFDLQYLFGMPESKNKYVLAIGAGEDAVAVLLNSVPMQIDIDEQNRLNSLPPLPGVLRPHVRAVYHSNGLWVDCDLMSFFESLREYVT